MKFIVENVHIKVTDSQYEIMKDLKSFIISDRDYGWWPSKRSLNALIKKGLIQYGVNKSKTEIGYYLTELGHKCIDKEG